MSQPLLFQASGMHCKACAALIRQKLRTVNGVIKVQVSHRGRVSIWWEGVAPSIEVLNQVLQEEGYGLTQNLGESQAESLEVEQAIAALFIAFLLFSFLQKSGLMHQAGVSLGLNGLMSALALGLLAGFSTCMAVTGSLVMMLGRRSQEITKNASSFRTSFAWFLSGRILAYGLSGVALGLLGRALMPSTTMNGVVALLVGTLMVFLGLKGLGFLPQSLLTVSFPMTGFQPLLDRCVDGKHPFHAGGLGALTVFLPCGFTQALQLWALAYGDAVVGGLMLASFAFGTLPPLVLFGVLGGVRHKSVQRWSGALVAAFLVLFGLGSAGGGLGLLGLDPRVAFAGIRTENQPPQVAEMVDGHQEIKLEIAGLSYSPSQFLVQPGQPVVLQVDAQKAAGCARVFQAPGLGIDKLLSAEHQNSIRFTPKEEGKFPIHCGMAMTTPGAAITVKKGAPIKPRQKAKLPKVPPSTEPSFFQSYLQDDPDQSNLLQHLPKPTAPDPGCFPGLPTCPGQARKVRLLFGGKFNPSLIQVEKGVPVGLTIHSTFTPKGCLAEVAIPALGIIAPMNKGETRVKFTPQKSGKFVITCGMQMIDFGFLEVSG